jgi:hypothetical protein
MKEVHLFFVTGLCFSGRRGIQSFSYPARQKIPAKPIPLINPFDSRSSKPYGTGMTATLSSPYLSLLQSLVLIPTLNVAVANPGQIAQPNPGQIVRRAPWSFRFSSTNSTNCTHRIGVCG